MGNVNRAASSPGAHVLADVAAGKKFFEFTLDIVGPRAPLGCKGLFKYRVVLRDKLIGQSFSGRFCRIVSLFRPQTSIPVFAFHRESNRTDQLPVCVGFWLPVGAFLIDTRLLLLVCAPRLRFFYGAAYYDFNPNAPLIAGFADFLISCIFPVVAMLASCKARGATPGKIRARALPTIAPPHTGRANLCQICQDYSKETKL